MKYLMPSIRFTLFMTLLLGFIYPFAMTGLSQILLPRQANGDFLKKGDQIIGSSLIAQKFEKSEYFWPRPSATDYNPLPSGGSNLGQTNESLKKTFDERKAKLKSAHPDQSGEPPQDLLFASGSGLDPHISPEAAQYQAQRVAKFRNMSLEQIQKLIQQTTQEPILGIFGESTVNVLALNMAVDEIQGISSTPIKPQDSK